ncbi:MAG: ribosome biogenesis GTPase Der [Acidobacteriota bacterium]
MRRPAIALIGAPNVGKSTLFNRLVHRTRTLVHSRPGMTRDRVVATATLGDLDVEIIDTGGLFGGAQDDLVASMERQSIYALDSADLAMLVVDGRLGLIPADLHLADLIRRLGKAVMVVVNKLDSPELMSGAAEFHGLGFPHVIGISAAHGLGFTRLEECVEELLPARMPVAATLQDEDVAVAIIGRPNVGKSSLLNRLLHEERTLVSPRPGTTRDAVDTLIRSHGHRIRLVDTAGLRQRKAAADEAEALAIRQARQVALRTQIAVLVMDASSGITSGDLSVAQEMISASRAVVQVVNKWDLVSHRDEAARRLEEEARKGLRFIPHQRLLTVSARTGLRAAQVLREVLLTHAQFIDRRPTSEWNRILQAAVATRPPPLVKGKRLRFYYAVQAGSGPPALNIFLNSSLPVPEAYHRFLERKLREGMDLLRTPLHLSYRARRPRRA